MGCSVCSAPTVVFSVPKEYHHVIRSICDANDDGDVNDDDDEKDDDDDGVDVAVICTRCLHVEPSQVSDSASNSTSKSHSASTAVSDSPSASSAEMPSEMNPDEPDFSFVSDAFPTRTNAGVPFALAISLCSSLATNREAIETLFEAVERAGVDPLLAIDRLVADESVDPLVDLDRRRDQLAQLLS